MDGYRVPFRSQTDKNVLQEEQLVGIKHEMIQIGILVETMMSIESGVIRPMVGASILTTLSIVPYHNGTPRILETEAAVDYSPYDTEDRLLVQVFVSEIYLTL